MCWRFRVVGLLRFRLPTVLQARVEAELEVALPQLRRSLRRTYRNTAAW
jgi:hypothetical protein